MEEHASEPFVQSDRELARRVSGGIEVALYWSPLDDSTTVEGWDAASEEILVFAGAPESALARLQPEDVGFNAGGGRRVEGLRREEVAALASVSVDYIKRLEGGRIRPSDAVLDSLSRALLLDVVERAHLFALAGRTPAAHDAN